MSVRATPVQLSVQLRCNLVQLGGHTVPLIPPVQLHERTEVRSASVQSHTGKTFVRRIHANVRPSQADGSRRDMGAHADSRNEPWSVPEGLGGHPNSQGSLGVGNR